MAYDPIDAVASSWSRMMELIEPPHIVDRPCVATIGIRVVTPFRGMLATRDGLMRDIRSWSDNNRADLGPLFMRLHVVNMAGDMDIEVGAVANVPSLPDGRIRRGEFPAGRYATLTYVDHSIRANRHLIEWTDAADHAFDRRVTPAGDAFACRYEAILSDERHEKRKTRWRVQLNFKLVD